MRASDLPPSVAAAAARRRRRRRRAADCRGRPTFRLPTPAEVTTSPALLGPGRRPDGAVATGLATAAVATGLAPAASGGSWDAGPGGASLKCQ